MTALWLDSTNEPDVLRQRPLGGEHNERWLQDLVFDHPELIPMENIEPGAGTLIPVCKELRLPRGLRIDIFGVTTRGRPVIVECKLWRNPEARREVIAQLLDYAALVAKWSYSDLNSQIRSKPGVQGENRLYEFVRHQPDCLDEATFVDTVARNLKAGDFSLIIAGDGIHEGLHTIADHLVGNGARLTLVEFQLWADGRGRTLVLPQIPFKMEVVRQRLFVTTEGVRLTFDEPTDESEEIAPLVKAGQAEARAFWQRFIDLFAQAPFDHADQPAPRHGGYNWVRVPLPAPARWLTGYRYQDKTGFTLVAEEASSVFEDLQQSADELRQETGIDLVFDGESRSIGVSRVRSEIGDDDAQLDWLRTTANRLVNALRPRLNAM